MTYELLNHKAKCRLCFKGISGTRNISRITDSVQQKFFSLTNIELKSSDKFSNSICKPCFKSLSESSEFQTKMIDNQRRLFAFEGEAETVHIKQEAFEQQFDQFLDVQIKTESIDYEAIQMNERDPIPPEHNFRALRGLKTPDLPSGEANLQHKTERYSDFETVSLKREEHPIDEKLFGTLEVVGKSQAKGSSESPLRFSGAKSKRCVKNKKRNFPTEDEEVEVRIFVKNRTESGIKITNEDIVNCAIRVMKKRETSHGMAASTLTTQWIKNFRDRYSELSEFQTDEGSVHICDMCDFSTDKKKDLRKHMEFHAERQPESPAVKRRSNREYSKADLEKAVQVASSGSMSASAASKLFNVPKSTLLRDLHLLKGAKVFKCSYCVKVFFNASTKRSHEKTAHLTPAGEFPCSDCGKVYPTKEKLNVHHTYSHKVGGFKCSRCDQEFDRQYEMDKHFLEEHRPKVPCEICGKLIFKGNRYTSHLKTHGPEVKCPFEGCSNMYHDRKSMKYHIENTHAPKQKIKCPKCSSTFPNPDKLKRHDERSHGEARFLCKVTGCHYKSPRKDYLKLHLRNHRNIDVQLRDALIAQL